MLFGHAEIVPGLIVRPARLDVTRQPLVTVTIEYECREGHAVTARASLLREDAERLLEVLQEALA